MIEPQDLRKKARETKLGLDMVEKDYILGSFRIFFWAPIVSRART